MKVLVTGASGFIGSFLCQYLASHGISVTGTSRNLSKSNRFYPNAIYRSISHLASDLTFLSKFDVVIHLAGSAHFQIKNRFDHLNYFRKSIVNDTFVLADACSSVGVKRFIYLSSIKVHGDSNSLSSPFGPYSPLRPDDFYGLLKLEAEAGLAYMKHEYEMEIVIVRPPLVYGPQPKGNFKLLTDLVRSKAPIPFKSISYNSRSFVSLYNLCDFLIVCITHPHAANSTFVVSDQFDVSTKQLIESLAIVFNVPDRLFSLPEPLLRFSISTLLTPASYDRLCGTLIVDSSSCFSCLGWSPTFSFLESLDLSFSTYSHNSLMI